MRLGFTVAFGPIRGQPSGEAWSGCWGIAWRLEASLSTGSAKATSATFSPSEPLLGMRVPWHGYPTDQLTEHSQVSIQILGRDVWVDRLMGPLLQRMNDLGMRTYWSCQGNPGVKWYEDLSSGACIVMAPEAAAELYERLPARITCHAEQLLKRGWRPADHLQPAAVYVAFPQEGIGEFFACLW